MYKVAIESAMDYSWENVNNAMNAICADMGWDIANPFGSFIEEGMTVFIKPNWVASRWRESCEHKDDIYSVITHPSVIGIRYPRGSMPDAGDFGNTSGEDYEVIGNSDASVAVVTYGRLYFNAVGAIHMLAEKGINAKIIKINKIKPLPDGVVQEAVRCKKLFFFEEGMRAGGVGECLASKLLEKGYDGGWSLTAVDGEFVAHASVNSLMEKYSLSAEKMYEKILNGVMQ